MKLTPFNFLRTIQKSLEDIPSPRTAGRGIGRGVPLVEPPLPQNRTTDEMHRLRCCPLLHKYCEGEGDKQNCQQVRRAL